MSNSNLRQPQKSHKKIIITASGIGAVLVILFGWWLYGATRTYPLGDKAEYVGKEDYGCYISLTICDSDPSSVYYYATNMTQDELQHYFKGVHLEEKPRTIDGVTDFTLKKNDNEVISIYYYTDKKDAYEKHRFQSDKKYTFSISRYDYQTALDSLK